MLRLLEVNLHEGPEERSELTKTWWQMCLSYCPFVCRFQDTLVVFLGKNVLKYFLILNSVMFRCTLNIFKASPLLDPCEIHETARFRRIKA